ncbi:hypothetical protein M422DRAFT_87118, partial [Sphaerobolus stellatus SS14]
DSHRNKSPAIHAGFWSHYCKNPYLTRDSRPVAGQQALDDLLAVVGTSLAPLLTARLKLYDPGAYHRLESTYGYIKSLKHIQDIFSARPALDFGGLCGAISIKDGGSQIPHIDWLDHPQSYAIVICIGPGWKGGKLVLPQLGRAIPTSPRQVIVFQSRRLAHFTGPMEGDRLSLTCFVD